MVERRIVRDVLIAKASGYLACSMSSSAILTTINLIASSKIFVPADMIDEDIYARSRFLTRHEHDALYGLFAENSNNEIASKLSLSEMTITHHLKSLRSKLNARNRTYAICRAIELGIK